MRSSWLPSATEVTRLLAILKKSGMEVGSVEVKPDGAIKVSKATASPSAEESIFDRLVDEGRL